MINGRQFNLSDLQSSDESELEITYPGTGEPTGWILTIAGPGHPKTIALADAQAKANLSRQRLIEQAQVNGKKYKAPEIDVETERRQNLENIIARVIGWRGLFIDGEEVQFSEEKSKAIFLDRRYDKPIAQVIAYLLDEQSFTKRSGAT